MMNDKEFIRRNIAEKSISDFKRNLSAANAASKKALMELYIEFAETPDLVKFLETLDLGPVTVRAKPRRVHVGDRYYCPHWDKVFIVTDKKPGGRVEMASEDKEIQITRFNRDVLEMEKVA